MGDVPSPLHQRALRQAQCPLNNNFLSLIRKISKQKKPIARVIRQVAFLYAYSIRFPRNHPNYISYFQVNNSFCF
jgi:hypothetical protein